MVQLLLFGLAALVLVAGLKARSCRALLPVGVDASDQNLSKGRPFIMSLAGPIRFMWGLLPVSPFERSRQENPVSYTHLTLPTICSV